MTRLKVPLIFAHMGNNQPEPIQTTILPQYNLIVLIAEGAITDDDLVANMKRFTDHPDFKINMDSMVLLEEATINFNALKLLKYAEYMDLHKHIRGDKFRMAVVSAKKDTIERAKLFKMVSREKQFRFRQFESVEEATAWLLGETLSRQKIVELIEAKRNQ